MSDNDVLTERLHLRPFTADDAGALHDLWTSAEVRRYLWDDQIIPREQTGEIIALSSELFREKNFGLWGLMLRDSGALAGFGGYWYFREPPELELILGLDPQWWGKGLATEAGKGLLSYGFGHLGMKNIQASTDAGNQASVRLMERLGMNFERREIIGGLDTLFYRASENPRSLSSPNRKS